MIKGLILVVIAFIVWVILKKSKVVKGKGGYISNDKPTQQHGEEVKNDLQ